MVSDEEFNNLKDRVLQLESEMLIVIEYLKDIRYIFRIKDDVQNAEDTKDDALTITDLGARSK